MRNSRTLQLTSIGASVAILLAGCATTGSSSQWQNQVYDTHRRVVRLDSSLEASVQKLNETSAQLTARVNESDEQTRRVAGMVEENQAKLDSVSRDLADLKETLYRRWNLSVGSGASTPSTVEGQVSGVTIEPPQSSVATSAPAQTPVGGEAAAEPVVAGDPGLEYQDAQQSYANENYTDALAKFDAFLQRYPTSEPAANAQFWKAKCHLNLGNYQESVSEFGKVLSNYPNNTKAPFALHDQAVAYQRLGETDRAAQLLQQVIDTYPLSPAADQSKSDLQRLRG